MRRTIGAVLALLALAALPAPKAIAQVAVPELVPAAVRVFNAGDLVAPMNSLVPENPAAMQWGAPSRIALGVLAGDKTTQSDGLSNRYDGSFGGFRWVRQGWALGAETTQSAVEFPSPVGIAPPAPRVEKKQRTVALSIAWPSWLGIGVSARRMSADTVSVPPGPPPPTMGVLDRFEFSSWTFGLSWRMGEHVFLGGGYGKETVEHTFPPSPGSLDRTHYTAGLALRGGGTLVWRLEADTRHVDSLLDPLGNPKMPGHDLNLVSAEGILGSWLLGGAAYNAKVLKPQGDTIAGYTVDFGYAPLSGFTLTWRFEHSEVKDGVDPSIVRSKEEVNNAVLAWQF